VRAALVFLAVASIAVLAGTASSHAAAPAAAIELPLPATLPNHCPSAQPVPAPLKVPTVLPPGEPPAVQQLETSMLAYLYGIDPNIVPSHSKNLYPYRRLGWCVDKYVRDTGAYVHGDYFGTHPAVRIYYSPEMVAWMRGGRRGYPADGAVMIKEQYPPPAAQYRGKSDDQLQPHDWTIMIRKAAASHDGWFWAELYTKVVPPLSPTNGPMSFGGVGYPNASYGLYCVRCHASADKAMTFASLRNVKGYPGDPILYYVDDSWRTPPPKVALAALEPIAAHTAAESQHPRNVKTLAKPVAVVPEAIRQTFPPEPYDQMVTRPTHAPRVHFLTSDQCMSCHSAATGAIAGPTMWLTPPPNWSPTMPPAPPGTPAPTAPPPYGVNVSPYGEWRWSPMGLAGRDPVFFSQLESEIGFIDSIPAARFKDHPVQTRETLKVQVTDLCLRCHGVMGKRTNDAENGPNAHFNQAWIFASWPSPAPGTMQTAQLTPREREFHYGGLARDGISCTVCHQIRQTKAENASLALVLNKKATGLFDVDPQFTQLRGPFADDTIAAHPMKEALDVKPVFAQFTTSSRLCASCHSIDLPVVDEPAKIVPISGVMPLPNPHDVEQDTYVEWVNSRFQTEYNPGTGARSCQACHMPSSVDNNRVDVHVDSPIRTRIAITQDQDYPEADNLAPIKDITVPYREKGFRRHELLGLNAFLLRTFQQNPLPLGVRTGDYMSGSKTDLDDAIGNVLHQARTSTATMGVTTRLENGALVADVGVKNQTGHRFPSGVGFRRAFVELDVTDPSGTLLWASGRTNGNGEILDGTTSTVLSTEYFVGGAYQTHHDAAHPIVSSKQVQIFEELVKNQAGEFTESFIRRDEIVKDNRLLPQGWKHDGQPGFHLPPRWLEATHPKGQYVDCDRYPKDCDRVFSDGEGRAVVGYRIPLGEIPTAVDPSRLQVVATLWYQSWEPKFRRDRTHHEGLGSGLAAQRLRVLLGNLQLDNTPLQGWKLQIASTSTAASP
jgi:hypothetical protein